MLFRCGTNFSVEYFDDKMHCEPPYQALPIVNV